MKKFRKLLILSIAALGLVSLQSCDKDDDYSNLYANALVTVKPLNGGEEFYLQLNENTMLKPVNITKSPYGNKKVRALINFEDAPEQSTNSIYKPVVLNWIDSIRTKEIVPTLGGEIENLKEYGDDALDIVRDWVTIAEDGYLTLRFRTYWGYTNISHTLNLVYGQNPKNPYEITLYHNNNGDFHERIADGIIAFDLSKLPDTKGEWVDLTLKWKSLAYNSERSATFKYKTTSSTPGNVSAIIADFNEFESVN
ncbi:MAG: NigD-like protein [Bacteroidia bacterium]|nr:NigD-like protein [Bacteroidia bacterium]